MAVGLPVLVPLGEGLTVALLAVPLDEGLAVPLLVLVALDEGLAVLEIVTPDAEGLADELLVVVPLEEGLGVAVELSATTDEQITALHRNNSWKKGGRRRLLSHTYAMETTHTKTC